mmetsp:Transcript_30285/g.46230  ORF Transcript_30285/g.46230 Transcript_30285/m.46230 type:complete len:1013 (+) Transcript_30285:33-3071(+)
MSTMSVDLSSVTDASTFLNDNSSWEGEPSSPKFFGRAAELNELKSAYNSAKRNHSFERVFIRGESGSGKTSLVLALRETIIQDGGFFCSGKNFQNCGLGQDPHSSIMAGFSDLCDLILQSDIYNEALREKVQTSLGPDADLLVRAVSNISSFLDEANFTSRQVKYESVLVKFKAVCKNFLRAMSSPEHPVVFFLDDIQWMDQGTCEIIKFLLQDDGELSNIMIIMAYREEEVEHIQNSLLHHIKCKALEISVTPLEAVAVGEIIAAELETTAENIFDFVALISLVHLRTNGNAFHVYQLINSLKRDGHLKAKRNTWMLDPEVIKSSEKLIEESLARFLSNEIQRLDIEKQEVLKIASIIGYSFSEATLFDVASEVLEDKKVNKETVGSIKTLRLLLDELVKEKFIKITPVGYQFTHDKLQNAFLCLMAPDEIINLHKIIGYKFLNQPSDVSQYQAALHLNLIGAAGKKEHAEFARMNFRAAKYCEFRSAFLEAVTFLRHGLSFLEDGDKWGENFDLAFEMTQLLVNVEFIVGNLEACKAANKIIFSRAKTMSMQYDSLLVELDVRVADNDLEDMLQCGLKFLHQLGERIPKAVTPFYLLQKVKKVRKMVDRMTDEDFLKIPRGDDDPRLLVLFQVLMRVCINAILRQKFVLGFYAAVRAAELTMTDGLSLHSSHALYAYGIVEKKLGYIDRAHRVGILALKLFAQFPIAKAECHVFPGMCMNLLHLKCRIWELLDLHPDITNYGLDAGDFVSISLASGYIFHIKVLTGENLPILEAQIRRIYHQVCDSGQELMAMGIQPLLQYAINLQRTGSNFLDYVFLNGEIMNEDGFESRCSVENNVFHLIPFYLCKMLLLYHFGFYEQAEIVSIKLKSLKTYAIEYSFCSIPFNFYRGMIFYERYRSTKKRSYLRQARKAKKVVYQEHLYDNPNATPFLKILNIEELARKTQNTKELIRSCDQVISTQDEEGLPHLEMLANEQAARILCAAGSSKSFKYLEQAAFVSKVKWGSNAKYN